ncbi:TPA: Lrp/AsnC family transcriptional regulator [Candidatus Bathyarchaeota archaeon]|nr:Lrp/AsnC family transcriptional regulator [Candidatus Bathyarchaeota archaeon]
MAVKAYVMMKVSSGSERKICKKIVEFEEVMDVSIVYGEFDIIAKVKVDELETLESFLSENLRNMPSIMLTSTMIVAREYKGKAKRNALKVRTL